MARVVPRRVLGDQVRLGQDAIEDQGRHVRRSQADQQRGLGGRGAGGVGVELAEGGDDATGRDDGVGEDRVGAHAGTLADPGGSAHEDALLEGDVLGELGGDVHPGGGRVDDADALSHPAAQDPPVELGDDVRRHLLEGEAGVGKTAVVEGLALRIAADDVPPPLRGVALHDAPDGVARAFSDVEELAALPWHRLVLDEAQMVKNNRSRGAKAVRRLDAEHRLALTGTPVENPRQVSAYRYPRQYGPQPPSFARAMLPPPSVPTM